MILSSILLWSFGSVAFLATVEYAAHRYFMHRRLLDRVGLGWVFHYHAIVHHRDGRNDQNVDLPIHVHFVWGFPIIVVCAWVDPIGAGILSACFLGHSILWTRLHRAIHGLENNWTKRLWIYRIIERHHLEHHHRPGRNFGAVFPFMDLLFGTYARPGQDAGAASGSPQMQAIAIEHAVD
jgi:sterol desaturase/sphingolipid hydroxylase (fatty acid hydroxylase superfamily)